ncbi:putative geranylgeranyl transferase type-2 subunit beta [Nosema granulosis]|uniref:Geranylgeranyl transferase type-2 subunit beta n=1 Tax=Nosema granulosis TaxID=83296 RepID=A0A9P6KZB4_9MICR|nr:putative geranylgeranyl transferase type-2 subunit beta [Nosema granulosis]
MLSKHLQFIKHISEVRDVNFYLTEPTRISTVYWAVNAHKIMKKPQEHPQEILDFVMSCKNLDGGFGGNTGYPSTILTTFNALQILYILKHPYTDENTLKYICSRISPYGFFTNDRFKESDSRIQCSGVLSLRLYELLSKGDFSKESLSLKISEEIIFPRSEIVNFIMKCYNTDGGFGNIPGGESHNAFTFCCLSALRSLGALESFGESDLCRFIALRQHNNGGLSGRIGKKEDVCYSFWAYASLLMLGRREVVDEKKLMEFILSCESQKGGFSDRPGNEPDLYHLMFSLAALGLLGYKDLYCVDPGFCL